MLCQLIPNRALYGLHNVGHMGPLTHANIINGSIEFFIDQQLETEAEPGFAVAA
jgi:hypothetical protein